MNFTKIVKSENLKGDREKYSHLLLYDSIKPFTYVSFIEMKTLSVNANIYAVRLTFERLKCPKTKVEEKSKVRYYSQ